MTRCSIKVEWRFDLVMGVGDYVCNFRRRVVRVWVQLACRANFQSGKHYPWKPNCLWRDASRWTSCRHCVLVSRLAGSLRCWCCTCCREAWKMKAWISRGIGYYTVYPSQGPAIFCLSFQKIVEATLWAWTGLRKRTWNRREGGRAQLLKERHSTRA